MIFGNVTNFGERLSLNQIFIEPNLRTAFERLVLIDPKFCAKILFGKFDRFEDWRNSQKSDLQGHFGLGCIYQFKTLSILDMGCCDTATDRRIYFRSEVPHCSASLSCLSNISYVTFEEKNVFSRLVGTDFIHQHDSYVQQYGIYLVRSLSKHFRVIHRMIKQTLN